MINTTCEDYMRINFIIQVGKFFQLFSQSRKCYRLSLKLLFSLVLLT